MAAILPPGKYQLRSLHEEIALSDRKLSHMQNYETYPTEKDKEIAIQKHTAKRSLLIRKAQEMIDNGIEVTFSPRQKAPEQVEVVPTEAGSVSTQAAEGSSEELSLMDVPSPFSGTSLDFRAEVEEYKANRSRRRTG